MPYEYKKPSDIELVEQLPADSKMLIETDGIIKRALYSKNDFITAEEKGQPNGVATLNEDGKIPSEQLDIVHIPDASILEADNYILSAEVPDDGNAIYMWTKENLVSVFPLVITQNESGQFLLDKSLDEIYTASRSGKIIIGIYDSDNITTTFYLQQISIFSSPDVGYRALFNSTDIDWDKIEEDNYMIDQKSLAIELKNDIYKSYLHITSNRTLLSD